MRRFYLFRSDLRILEKYHQYKTSDDFKKFCWDYYLLQGIYFLENNYFDEVIIWRLQPKKHQQDIIFNINGKQFIQRWVDDFKEVFKYPKPLISFFRGGFKSYCKITKLNPKFFGVKLYLGASKRFIPEYGGIYDKILVESEKELKTIPDSIPFYKTANPNIFKPLVLKKKYNICWPNNFTQINYKGQEFFISIIRSCPYLKSLKIVHVGNKPEIGMKICKKYNVKNIEFKGHVDRFELNKILNQSKFGLVTSNLNDGCPRISTEILMSGTPLIIREHTKLLKYYKQKGVVEFNDKNIIKRIRFSMKHYSKFSNEVLESVKEKLSFSEVCEKNIDLWLL